MTSPFPAASSSAPLASRDQGVHAPGSAPGRKPRVLLVEDEVIVARDIELQLEELGFAPVGHTRRGEEAVGLAETLRPDLVLMDVRLAGAMDGIAAAEVIRARLSVPVVFLTANHEGDLSSSTPGEGTSLTIAKPFDEHTLRVALLRALGHG